MKLQEWIKEHDLVLFKEATWKSIEFDGEGFNEEPSEELFLISDEEVLFTKATASIPFLDFYIYHLKGQEPQLFINKSDYEWYKSGEYEKAVDEAADEDVENWLYEQFPDYDDFER